MTGAEMAEILGTSRGAVRVRLTRARERLRAVLSGVEARDGDARG
ncbi:MAG: sigma factor-like helix-turn-helix DNA-binding protein [Candidatus Microbacterium stercoravium]